MRIYKTRADFTKLQAAQNPSVFAGTICTITDEATNPMYTFQNNVWNELGVGSGGSGDGAAANSVVTVDTVTVTTLKTPLFGGKHNGQGLGGYPKRKTLASFEGTATTLSLLIGGTCALSEDYTDPFVGDTYNAANSSYGNAKTNGKSIKLASSNFGKRLVIPNAVNAVACDVSAGNIYVQVKFSTDNQSTDLYIRLYSTGTPATAGADYVIAKISYQYYRLSGDWQTFGVPIESFTVVGAGATLTSITHAGVSIDNAASSACDVLIGDVFFCPRILSKGSVIIGFDDCRSDTWTDGAKYMMRKGIPGVLYPGAVASVLRGGVDQFQMSVRQMELLQRLYGWQIAYQAFDTEAPVSTADEFGANMGELHAMYNAAGWGYGNDGSYFSGVNINSAYDNEFRKNFRSMRSYKVFSSPQMAAVYGEVVPLPDPYNIRSIGVDTSTHTLANLTGVVDNCITRKSTAIFIFHAAGIGDTKFTGLIDYLDANRATVDCMTMDQLVNKINASSF